MSKATVTKLFIGSALAGLAGVILGGTAVGIAVANDVFVMNGQNIVGVQGGTLRGPCSDRRRRRPGDRRRDDRRPRVVDRRPAEHFAAREQTWFLVLLLLGIFSFGLFAMIAYVIAGPDGTRPAAPATAPTPA